MKIDKLVKIMEKLRDPNNGCPWDKKQTMESIIPHTIEEAYEVAEQIYNKNYNELKEELGDLLFQVVYLSQIASEKKKFNFYDVVESITSKMISRHPHVFKNKKFKNMKEFKLWWKKSNKKKQLSILDNIPFTYPAYLEANKIQKKVASVGFDYKNKLDAINKISEELEELKIEIKAQNQRKIKEELGDLIFATLDVSRKLKLDPEIILKKANNKFSKRWRKLESLAKKENLNLNKLSLKNYDLLWNKAKK
ncbi:MAG: nucleoside triphosphate pyrophosphohydrolase [Alphaproteobacteria bacterium]|nr:nucleoside triphosphate pyrophosphohydrolase [Alphaproteobacteria bacterium]